MAENMFEFLESISKRPEPFEYYTAADLWTDEHTSQQMLANHLNEDVDISSRNMKFIDRSVEWIVSRFGVDKGTDIVDFGCGPGLYTTRLARKQARVTGIDFSGRSISYAHDIARKERLNIQYFHQNYLEFETEQHFDLITMIMCDFCALSPDQRKEILMTFRRLLKPAGSVLLDVYSLAAFQEREEVAAYGHNFLDGFWSPNTNYGFQNTFRYEKEKLVLDKYTIVESDRIRTVYNWLQYFTPEELAGEFSACGLSISEWYADVAGTPFDRNSSEFAVVAVKND